VQLPQPEGRFKLCFPDTSGRRYHTLFPSAFDETGLFCPGDKIMLHAISGPGHAQFFLELAEKDEQGEPLATFVRGKGHVAFEGNDGAHLQLTTMEKILDPRYGMPGTPEGRYGE
jgi:hypothetical protein